MYTQATHTTSQTEHKQLIKNNKNHKLY